MTKVEKLQSFTKYYKGTIFPVVVLQFLFPCISLTLDFRASVLPGHAVFRWASRSLTWKEWMALFGLVHHWLKHLYKRMFCQHTTKGLLLLSHPYLRSSLKINF